MPRSEYVTVKQLALELEIDADRILPLIDRGYLRVMAKHADFAMTVLARPPKAAMDWLRTMFMPLDLRPMVPVQQIITALGISEQDLRYLCVSDNIPLYDDPVFGELMTVRGFYALHQGWLQMHNPTRSDRQALMLMLGVLKNAKHAGRLIPLPFSQRLEKEISRVAALEEPDRTMRATDLWMAYNDAETITECLEKYDALTPKQVAKRNKEKKVGKRVSALKNRMLRQGGKKLVEEEKPDAN